MAMRVKNIQYGTTEPSGKFVPWRGSADYDPRRLSAKSKLHEGGAVGRAARRKKKATGRKHKPASRTRNPIPVKWATAKVRKLGNDIQVMLFPKKTAKRKVAKRRPVARRRTTSRRR